MFLKTLRSVLFAVLGLAAVPAWADLCQAPFMRDGGKTVLTGSGALRLGADLRFSDVKHSGPNRCEARVQGSATFGFAGLPTGKSSLDYWMTVTDGNASFQRVDDQGRRTPVKGKFDLRMLGLFAYGQPITKAGQTFPAQNFEIQVDRKAVQADPVVVRTGLKTVGSKQDLETAAGRQSCWPLRYTRVIEATKASFNGIVLPLPAMTAQVTDWYCPAVHMVMKQESDQSGVVSVVEVTELQ